MFEDVPVHPCLAYAERAGAHPCVTVDFGRRGALSTLRLVEQVCIVIAQKQPGNPLGLFCHPQDALETGLCFTLSPEDHQKQVADLIWGTYQSCNAPMHVTVAIDGTEALCPALRKIVEAFHRPFDASGLIDDERGEPIWTWYCMVTPQTSAPLLAGFAGACDRGRLLMPAGHGDGAHLEPIRKANIAWPVEMSPQ